MSKCPSYEEIKNMSDEDLIKAYNKQTENTFVGTNFWLDEIIRRENDKITKRTIKISKISLGVAILSLISSIIGLFINKL